MRRFYVLLHRGLEYLPEETLNYYLNSSDVVQLDKPLDGKDNQTLKLKK